MLVKEDSTDPRVRRTRQLLQQAMIDLLQEKTVSSITVQDITTRATVNRATFYAHYEDKFALLNSVVRDMFQQKLDQRLTGTPGFNAENLRQLALTAFEYMGEFMGHCGAQMPVTDEMLMVRQVQAHLYDVLVGWLDDSRDEESAALVASWSIFGAVLQWGHAGRRQSPDALADQVVALLESGLKAHFIQQKATV